MDICPRTKDKIKGLGGDLMEQEQLNVLREIRSICKSREIRIWIRGGWAIDFLLGRITRAHSDVDLVSLVQYRDELEEALVAAGYEKIPVGEFQTDFQKDDVDVSFVFVRYEESGEIVANGFPEWVWRSDALSMKECHLEGISIPVLSPHQLLEEKQVHEQGTGRKLRPKDLESMRIIQGIIDSIE